MWFVMKEGANERSFYVDDFNVHHVFAGDTSVLEISFGAP